MVLQTNKTVAGLGLLLALTTGAGAVPATAQPRGSAGAPVTPAWTPGGTAPSAAATPSATAAPPGAAAGETCTIAAVRDAATLSLECPGGRRERQLGGVVAPRPGPPLRGGEPFGDESVAAARTWLLHRVVTAGAEDVRLDGVDLRLGLLARGLVQLGSDAAARAPDLYAAEREARRHQLGVWSHAAWQRHQAAMREPLDLPTPEPAATPALATVANRLARRSPAERREAFAAALAALAAREPAAPAESPP
jgi:endonuclease YncB( thermonuclease family)